MRGFAAFNFLKVALSLGLLAFAGLAAFVGFIWNEISREVGYYHHYGGAWKTEYESVFGSLGAARGRIGVCLFGIVFIIAMLVWIGKLSVPGNQSPKKKTRRRFGSNIERIVYYRRNALIGVVVGLLGIAIAVFSILFGTMIFADRENEVVFALFVFVIGYVGVICGCYWWTKAKDWNDGLVVIGLLPLVILFIPYVRLIFVAAPSLLPISMVLMPIILIVIVSLLPDKSEWPARKRWRLKQ
ncbi:hypothetical protein [Pedosphaera parvula]|uniref:Uncharacterized protein n=1 Tax=Pedosphaera parvula (strain Ellin514) TaxID=320771 RepID=B9XMH8_PEDPL|nr:hypothetical protein [Pedosphaera parvula]EEF59020.1 hypothetical protein Cflav_PD2069 [Pedosphaera parvula Ellin514]